MSKLNFTIVAVILITACISCKWFKASDSKKAIAGPSVDFTTPGKALDVKVVLDKKQTASGKISPAGGTVSLTARDGSKFTLDVPAKALETETEITITTVKTLDGAPLDKNTPTAVQLEPSGLFFKEMVTLTIVPAKEIPVREQIIFGYEGEGKDYHLAWVDTKSKDIKIKLMEFSGAGVGSGADSAWASNLQIQAENARTRLIQQAGQITQTERRSVLLGDESNSEAWAEQIKALIDQYNDQVILKEIVAAELDCQFARRAIEDILGMERQRQLLGYDPDPNVWQKVDKLVKIGTECKRSYKVSGQSNNVNFTGQICGLDKPFVLDATFPGGTAKTSFTPSSVVAGTTTVSGGGGGCEHSGGGNYSVSLKEDGSGTLTWTTNDKITCPGFGNSRTVTFTLPLQPAPDMSCP